MNFQAQFENLKKLDLPCDQFVVVGSGPMAVRGIREFKDIDVVVTPALWNEMSKKYEVVTNNFGVETLTLKNNIEVLNPAQSLFGNSKTVPIEEIFADADVFDGVKFVSLEHLKKIKLELGRENDLQDIQLIQEYIQKNKK